MTDRPDSETSEVSQTSEVSDGFRETPLGPLPVEWETVPFDDAILKRRMSVGKVKRQDFKPSGNVPIVDQGQQFIAGYWDDPTAAYDGELPVIAFGDHTRIFKFVDFAFILGADGVKVLVPDRSLFDPEFLYFAFSNLHIPTKGYSRHFKLLRECVLPLPPLPEQRAIARVLRTVQQAREATEEVIAAARELKRSLMRHLFTYGPVPVDQAERVELQETEMGLLPAHWEIGSARDLFPKITDGTHDTPEKLSQGIPLVTSKLLKQGQVLVSCADYFISEEDYEAILPRSGVGSWDVLYSMIGTIGEVAIVRPEHPRFSIKNVGLFKTGGDRELAEYTTYWLQSIHAQSYVRARASGSNQKYVPLRLLRDFPIPVPPISQQNEIVRFVDAVEAKTAAEEARRDALDELFRTLLHQLMTGRLRVATKTSEV
jgi:type I restriction enzyme S subunit